MQKQGGLKWAALLLCVNLDTELDKAMGVFDKIPKFLQQLFFLWKREKSYGILLLQ